MTMEEHDWKLGSFVLAVITDVDPSCSFFFFFLLTCDTYRVVELTPVAVRRQKRFARKTAWNMIIEQLISGSNFKLSANTYK